MNDYDDKVMAIDFLQNDLVSMIEQMNDDYLHDGLLYQNIATYYAVEDGIQSMTMFEEVIIRYHDILKEA